ncbi:methyltransferase [Paenibacillus flagellatus]|uniref:Malonyl-[acyl-carrier protein] O-methyltransferase BioC n=1 Tax=Paenibacillus flagellatus TaxID=2211139 RepID=A0A2V5JVA6_9BACL|nr:methyltransferase [Paenibacillus flagellatus]PYI50645.1 malonyl-[acyl-carrier protein] O-methyltransferase BioC [Paenibacillus flagellatus]
MGIDKSLVKKHFDRHAHEYETFADVQLEMAERLAALVSDHPAQRRGHTGTILEIGSGTGRLTAMLAAAFPEARIVCVELSGRMIEEARRKLDAAQPGAAGRVSYIEGDAEAVVARLREAGEGTVFDLVVSNAAFQWLDSPGGTAQACARLLRPGGGRLAFSTFGPNTFRQLHAAFARAEALLGLRPAPHGQTFAGKDEWTAWLAGLPGTFRWEERIRTEVHPDVRTFLHRVKRVGAGNAIAAGPRGVGGRRLIEAMERCYAESFASPDGSGVEADYHIGYGVFDRDDKEERHGTKRS